MHCLGSNFWNLTLDRFTYFKVSYDQKSCFLMVDLCVYVCMSNKCITLKGNIRETPNLVLTCTSNVNTT